MSQLVVPYTFVWQKKTTKNYSISDSCKREGFWGGDDNWLTNLNANTVEDCIHTCDRHSLCAYAAFVRVAGQCILYTKDSFVLTEDTSSVLYAKSCPPQGMYNDFICETDLRVDCYQRIIISSVPPKPENF